jgi:SnoaL-like domain
VAVELPRAIQAYFAAAADDDADALVGCFADDAVVIDEDRSWRGHAQIVQWREEVATKFDYTIDVRGVRPRGTTDREDGDDGEDGGFRVQARLQGDFPGGIVDLDFGFVVRSGLITQLEIVPARDG